MSSKSKSKILYRRKHLIVTQSRCNVTGKIYYTIVNLITNQHSHVDNFKAAVIVCNRAAKQEMPKKYPTFLKNAIRRVI